MNSMSVADSYNSLQASKKITPAGQAQGLSALSQLEFKGNNPITGRSMVSSNKEEDSPTKNDSPSKGRESLNRNFGIGRDPT